MPVRVGAASGSVTQTLPSSGSRLHVARPSCGSLVTDMAPAQGGWR